MNNNKKKTKFILSNLVGLISYASITLTLLSPPAFGYEERSYSCIETHHESAESQLKNLHVVMNVFDNDFHLIAMANVDSFLPKFDLLSDVTPHLYNLKNRYVGFINPGTLSDAQKRSENQNNWHEFIGLDSRAKMTSSPDLKDSYSVWMSNIQKPAEYLFENVNDLRIMDRFFVQSAIGSGRLVIPKSVIHGHPQSFEAQLRIHSKFHPEASGQGIEGEFVKHNYFEVLCSKPEADEQVANSRVRSEDSSERTAQNLAEDSETQLSSKALEQIKQNWHSRTESERESLVRNHELLVTTGGIIGIGLGLSKALKSSIPVITSFLALSGMVLSAEPLPPACTGPSLFENIQNLSAVDLKKCLNGSEQFRMEMEILLEQMDI